MRCKKQNCILDVNKNKTVIIHQNKKALNKLQNQSNRIRKKLNINENKQQNEENKQSFWCSFNGKVGKKFSKVSHKKVSKPK